MEPEEIVEETDPAVLAAAPGPSSTAAAPRARKPRTRVRAPRSTASRSATTAGPDPEPRSAPVLPIERTTVADALIAAPANAAPTTVYSIEPEPVVEPEPELVPVAPAEVADSADAAFGDLLGATVLVGGPALSVQDLRKSYGSVTAVDGVSLVVEAGSFFGVVGPNGAGKTTTLSMLSGMLRPDSGSVAIHGTDMWPVGRRRGSAEAKRAIGVLPDRLRLFDRLSGAQLLEYAGALRGVDHATVARRGRELAEAFGLTSALRRPVSDYSLGMTKKVAIAAALIHSPRLLVLDEPFESVDPVSASRVLEVLRRYTAAGGTVILSSHSMELIESACDAIAIIADGRLLASGSTAEVLAGVTLEDRFVDLAGGRSAVSGMEWLHSYTD